MGVSVYILVLHGNICLTRAYDNIIFIAKGRAIKDDIIMRSWYHYECRAACSSRALGAVYFGAVLLADGQVQEQPIHFTILTTPNFTKIAYTN